MEEACTREIEGLHRFFEGWFLGMPDEGGGGFARFQGVLAPEFLLISPDGEVRDLPRLLGELRAAHGRYRDSIPPFRIEIRAPSVRWRSGEVALATYEEWQEMFGVRGGRLATAVFRARPDTPNGVEWLHVHEVWLPAPPL